MATESQRRRQKIWYQKHRRKIIGLRNARRLDIRSWLLNLKKKLKCINCGFSHHAALQFHHRYDKKFEISDFGGYSKGTILKEISKCDVLCANCHAILNFGE